MKKLNLQLFGETNEELKDGKLAELELRLKELEEQNKALSENNKKINEEYKESVKLNQNLSNKILGFVGVQEQEPEEKEPLTLEEIIDKVLNEEDKE